MALRELPILIIYIYIHSINLIVWNLTASYSIYKFQLLAGKECCVYIIIGSILLSYTSMLKYVNFSSESPLLNLFCYFFIISVIGTAFALNMLFKIPLWCGVLITGLSTLVLLLLQQYGVSCCPSIKLDINNRVQNINILVDSHMLWILACYTYTSFIKLNVNLSGEKAWDFHCVPCLNNRWLLLCWAWLCKAHPYGSVTWPLRSPTWG